MKIEATHLGKLTSYPKSYDPQVLVAVPRKINREQYDIKDCDLPFKGLDVWHAYEFGFMTRKGMPVVGLLKIIYPANNLFLVESKSLKLYLNSFNMERIGNSIAEGIKEVLVIIKNDLQKILECEVMVNYFNHKSNPIPVDFGGCEILEDELSDLEFSIYNEAPDLLDEIAAKDTARWGTHLLRSNCKITNQPDWGSLFISMDSDVLPSKESFLQYIVSLRNENHFHEEICEMVYKRLSDKYHPKELMVTCLYTRRGGIDINPVRVSDVKLVPRHLVNFASRSQSTYRQ